ncbi:uncharacterized protein LOC116287980, partial [Actinia tenebrosa]|uniref:Uncharacterized protein LOC116287980 n=1 Tax=Actinia tenebrosa TaxID=6105 RepID=A0A6P8H4T6_ACTTE
GDGSDDDSIHINQTVDPEYYSSRAWESYIDQELDTFTVLQPQINVSASSQQTSQSVHHHHNIQIAKSSLGTSKFWFLPPQLSQATLFGRNGSNACTFISLLMAKEYTSSLHYATLQLTCNSDLNQTWLSLLLSAIARGNQVYDNVTQSLGNPFFSVAEANHHLTAVIAPVTVTLEESLDLSITSVDPQVSQSSLAFYLQRLVRERNLAALIIANGMTVCFVGQNNNVYFLDSHPHYYGQVFGAMVGMAQVDKLEEFLINIKQQICPNFNVCSLTFASFV